MKGQDHGNHVAVTGPNGVGDDVLESESERSIWAGEALFSLVGKFFGLGLKIATQALIARVLGPGKFGLFVVAWTVLRISRVFGISGLDKGLVRFGVSGDQGSVVDLKHLCSRAFAIGILISLFLSTMIWILREWLADRVFSAPDLRTLFFWVALALPLVVLLRLAGAGTRISLLARYSVAVEDLTQPLIFLVLTVAFLSMGFGLHGVFGAFVISLAVAILALAVMLPRVLHFRDGMPAREKPDMGRLVNFSVQASLGAVFTMMMLWLDRLMVGAFRPPFEVGVYQAGAQVAMIFPLIVGSLGAAFAPMAARQRGADPNRDLDTLFRLNTHLGLFIATPLFISILFANEAMVVAVFGRPFAGAALPLMVLAVGQFINAATGSVGQLLVMTGHQKLWFLSSGSAVAVNIGLNIFLIPRYGILGASWATAISISGLFLLGLVMAYRLLDVWPYRVQTLRFVVAAIAAAVVLFALGTAGISHPVWWTLVSLLTSGCVFGLVFLRFPLDSAERSIVDRIHRRIFPDRKAATP